MQEWCEYRQHDVNDLATAGGADLVKQYLIWQYEDGKYVEEEQPAGFTGKRDVKRPGRRSKNGERMVR